MRVAVIGAGAAGLVSARWLIEARFDTVVFERTAAVGGLWRPDTGLAYPSLRTNTSKQKTAFSDLPFDGELPDFPGRDDVLAYLERYADRTGVRSCIRFHHAVGAVRPAGAGWTVDGERFAAVVIATGLFASPVEPPLPGRGRFRGTIMHSGEFRDPAAFAGLDVIVAGPGSSGADIACDLAGVARSVGLAMRSVPVFAPRYHRGRPNDHRLTRLHRRLPLGIRRWLARRVIAPEYRRCGLRLEQLGPTVTPGTRVLEEVASGRIVFRPALVGLDDGTAMFADGSRATADAIVLATGYAPSFPFLPDGLPPTFDGALALYRLVFPPGVAGLAFVGMTRVAGAVFPVAEMQARWAAAVFAGRAALPPPDVMRDEIEGRIARAHAARDDQMRVDQLAYLDDIASRIGAKPSLWRHPRLLVSPVSARDYRRDPPT